MEFRFFSGRKCWEVKVCMTFDANQWVWYYISLKFPLPWTIFFPKLSEALSPSALLSFEACTCFYVTRFQCWRTHVLHFGPTLNFMWETDEECVMSRTQDYRSCGRDTARYLRVGRRRMETGLSAASVGSMAVEWRSSLGRHRRPNLCGDEQWRPRRFLWRSCLLRVWDFSTTCFFLMFCWSQRGCAERFRSRLNILCDLVFKPTPSEEDLTVTRSWVLMSSIILFISYAACKWNHWQVLFINDEAITRKMGAHTEGHNRFQ